MATSTFQNRGSVVVEEPKGPFYIAEYRDGDYEYLFCVRIRNEQLQSWESPFMIGFTAQKSEAEDQCERLNSAAQNWANSHPLRRMILFAESETV